MDAMEEEAGGEGPDKDPTWIQSLPSEALRLTMKHFLGLAMGSYKSEIAGALSQPRGEKYSLENFHEGHGKCCLCCGEQWRHRQRWQRRQRRRVERGGSPVQERD